MGPTASGKTALALAIAQHFQGEVVSCDSVAVYRGMEIGTAKPTPAERVLVSHHLIDIANPGEPCTAGDYSRLARQAIAAIAVRRHLPVVTGGTGLYLRALLDGLFAGPQRSEPLRERLRDRESARGAGWLHRILTRIDPASAAHIHPHDQPKLIRAIEVTLAGRRPQSEAWQQGRDPLTGYRILRLGLDPGRAALYARINARAAAMFEAGLVEETARLHALYGDVAPLNSLGYRQARAVLNGQMKVAQAIAGASQGHRNYAKRQMTWFRREPGVLWFEGFGDDAIVRSQALARVAAELPSQL
ncbi:MAG TPA: tRNA (adenosine(37)-N6)-dimethylallyltransferase MiaA [Acidisarcina sp.]